MHNVQGQAGPAKGHKLHSTTPSCACLHGKPRMFLTTWPKRDQKQTDCRATAGIIAKPYVQDLKASCTQAAPSATCPCVLWASDLGRLRHGVP